MLSIVVRASIPDVRWPAWYGSPGPQAKTSGRQLVSSKSMPCFGDVALRIFLEDPAMRRCILKLAVRGLRL
jgi:hypothetical protein